MSELSLHPLNDGFSWQTPSGPYRRITEDQARSWSEQGFLVVEDAFSPEVMTRVIGEIDPFEAQVEAFLQMQQDGKLFIARSGEITFTTHLVARSAYLRDFAAGPVFQDLVHDLVGNDVRLYWDQAVYKNRRTRPSSPGIRIMAIPSCAPSNI